LSAATTPEAIAKRRATIKERFGVESVLALPEIHALANTPEKCRQRHLTMKANGTYFTSKPEEALYQYLVARFQHVERQVVVNQWPIDFYVVDIDAYVQLDGAYWHGLDRPIEEIAQFKTPRDRTILRKFQIDREQDEWFRSTDRRLLRITDRQFARGELPDDIK
jgi:very-short-patch-repair endonuclease